jgi:hypothetical protein
MSVLSVQPTFPIFTEADGQPLENGYIWIGTANLDPQVNPIAVYWDAALTQPAVQPIRTINGYPAKSGSPGRLYVNSDYSIRVQNKNGSAVYSAASTTDGSSEFISFIQNGAGAVQRSVQAKLRDTVSVKDFGAVGDSTTNDSDSVNAAATAHTLVEVTKGSYLYTAATTVDPSRITLNADANIKGMKSQTVNIGSRNKDGKFIGFMQNYNETRNDAISTPITTGKFVSPPLSDASSVPGVDVLAYWYNDFGLECVRAAGGGIGSTAWYTWQWAHTVGGATTYDPAINPLLGWYRGDDPVVLDWICYWLREAGVKAILQQGRGDLQDTTNWSSSSQSNYWLYQLFNNVPNFKGLGYIPDMGSGGSLANNTALITNLQTNILSVYPNYYVTKINNKEYGTLWSYDFGTLRASTYSNNTANFETMLSGWATFFRNRGLDGVVVLARNGGFYTDTNATSVANRARAAQLGVEIFEVDYGFFSGVTPGSDSYSTMVSNFYSGYQAVKTNRIPNIMTGRQSHGNFHPSGWTNTGTTPALFSTAAQQAASMAVANITIPNIVTVYNVSEWGEGGPALQPTVGNGFGYLDAIRRINVPSTNKALSTVSPFSAVSDVKTGTATDAVAFQTFTITVAANSTSRVEVDVVAIEQTGYFATISRKYVFVLKNRSSTLAATAVNSVSGFEISESSANYSITPTVTVTIIDQYTARFDVTLTKGGSIGWTNCFYETQAKVQSVKVCSIA